MARIQILLVQNFFHQRFLVNLWIVVLLGFDAFGVLTQVNNGPATAHAALYISNPTHFLSLVSFFRCIDYSKGNHASCLFICLFPS